MPKFKTGTTINTYSKKPNRNGKTKPTIYLINNVHITNVNYVTNYNFTLSKSSSGDEFDKLFKGLNQQNQSPPVSASRNDECFQQRQDTISLYNSDATPSSLSSVHLFKDGSSVDLYSPSRLPEYTNKNKGRPKLVKNAGILKKKKKRLVKNRLPVKFNVVENKSPNQASSTPKEASVVEDKKKWFDVSPILPPTLTMSTPVRRACMSSPQDMFAEVERSSRKNKHMYDISALTAGLGNLGLATPAPTVAAIKKRESTATPRNPLCQLTPSDLNKRRTCEKKVNQTSRKQIPLLESSSDSEKQVYKKPDPDEEDICDKLLAFNLGNSLTPGGIGENFKHVEMSRFHLRQSKRRTKWKTNFDESRVKTAEFNFESKMEQGEKFLEALAKPLGTANHGKATQSEVSAEVKDVVCTSDAAKEDMKTVEDESCVSSWPEQQECWNSVVDSEVSCEQENKHKLSEMKKCQAEGESRTCQNEVHTEVKVSDIQEQSSIATEILSQKSRCSELDSPDSGKQNFSFLKPMDLVPGKKWRRSFIQQRQPQTEGSSRRTTAGPAVLAKLVRDTSLSMTLNFSSATSYTSNPSDSFFRRVSVRTKQSAATSYTSNPSDSFFRRVSVRTKLSAVTEFDSPESQYYAQFNLQDSKNTSLPGNHSVCERRPFKVSVNSKRGSSFGVVKPAPRPNLMDQILEESCDDHKAKEDEEYFIKEESDELSQLTQCEKSQANIETPPILKLHSGALESITKRKKTPRGRETFLIRNQDEEDFKPCNLFLDESTYFDCEDLPAEQYTCSRTSTCDIFQDGEEEGEEEGEEDREEEDEETLLEYTKRQVGLDHPTPFSDAFSEKELISCKKIGEGVYGEVFMISKPTGDSVVKIIPVGGDKKVNGDIPKRFEEVLSEVIVAEQLSNLRQRERSRTSGFCELKSKVCVQGVYPTKLLQLWDAWKDRKENGCLNDRPDMFEPSQHFIILELGHSGEAVETYKFHSAKQAFSVMLQAIFSLAVAEESLEFEHRDLHIGNILVRPTKDKHISYTLNDTSYLVPTYGLQATIIDFTLSRISVKREVLFFDLETDPELFKASSSDYQFEIYRLMRRDLNQDWRQYMPKTNIRWLHYLADKFLLKIKYKCRKNLKEHTSHMKLLKKLMAMMVDFDSASDLADFLAQTWLQTVNIILQDSLTQH